MISKCAALPPGKETKVAFIFGSDILSSNQSFDTQFVDCTAGSASVLPALNLKPGVDCWPFYKNFDILHCPASFIFC
jgi:hypothetical protein